jgi:uncharacterized surface protein with fasciclin (FAS1) repeats
MTMQQVGVIVVLAFVACALTGCGGGSTTTTKAPPPAPATKNIVQLAQATADLKTLVEAVVAANLTATLSGAGPFTVFAPTNEAFAKLPAGTLAGLLKPANIKQLQALLEYHVVKGKVLSSDLTNDESVPTLEGSKLTVTLAPGKVMINDVTVTTANVMATNGVVHIINGVLKIPTALEVYTVA